MASAAPLAAALALVLAACASAPAAAPTPSATAGLPTLDPQAQRGHDLAVRRCSGCHTVGLDDGGAQEGPAFYKLARRNNAVSLERRFAEVSAHGIERMPPVALTASEAADLVAYFATLDRP